MLLYTWPYCNDILYSILCIKKEKTKPFPQHNLKFIQLQYMCILEFILNLCFYLYDISPCLCAYAYKSKHA